MKIQAPRWLTQVAHITPMQAATLLVAATVPRDLFAGADARPLGTSLSPLQPGHGSHRQLLSSVPAPAPAPKRLDKSFEKAYEKLANTPDTDWFQDTPAKASPFAHQAPVDSALPEQRPVYNFETSVQGWVAGSTNDSVSLARGPAFDGTNALAFHVRGDSNTQHEVRIQGPETIPPNANVSLHLWVPNDASLRFAQLFMKDGAEYRYTSKGVNASDLTPGAWTQITLQAPADANLTQTLGLQLTTDGPWNGTAYVDAVGWAGNPTRDMSQSTAFARALATPAGPQLAIEGMPLKLLGYEAQVPHLESCGTSVGEMSQVLSRMRLNSGARVARVWFTQTEDFSRYDLVLRHAKREGMYIIPTLVNQWGNCEPTVHGSLLVKSTEWYQHGFKEANDGYPLSYEQYAVKFAKRYANEPNILFLQLGNELEAKLPNGTCDAATGTAALRGFADHMVRQIRTVNRNHLINLGTLGGDQCGLKGDGWKTINGGLVDVTEVHDYDEPAVALTPTMKTRIAESKALNKPIFVGEVGICRNVDASGNCNGNVTDLTLSQRAKFMGAKMEALLGAGASGVSVWASHYDSTYSVEAGDPMEHVMRKVALQNL